MQMNRKKIFIAGGGIAGLTLSLFLDPQRYDVVIFEKKSISDEIGAAISVFPNALSVLNEAGIIHEILQNAGEIKHSTLRTWDGKTIVNSNFNSEFPIICMHRKALHQVLTMHSKATIVCDKEVVDFENNISDVAVYFSDGSSASCDLLVGADGLHSRIRSKIIKDGNPIYRGANVWRGVVKSNFDLGYASETWGINKRVGIVPIKEGYFGWWATIVEPQNTPDEPSTREKLISAFNDWHYPIPDFIEQTETIIKHSIVDRSLASGWNQGRVVLLGDAAHPTTPNLGQGGCLAMEGAFVLSKCLEKYDLSKQALERYETLHFPRAKKIIDGSLRFGKLADLSNPLLVFARNITFKLTPAKLSQRMFGKYFNYRASKLDI